jgi:hypothetical protein
VDQVKGQRGNAYTDNGKCALQRRRRCGRRRCKEQVVITGVVIGRAPYHDFGWGYQQIDLIALELGVNELERCGHVTVAAGGDGVGAAASNRCDRVFGRIGSLCGESIGSITTENDVAVNRYGFLKIIGGIIPTEPHDLAEVVRAIQQSISAGIPALRGGGPGSHHEQKQRAPSESFHILDIWMYRTRENATFFSIKARASKIRRQHYLATRLERPTGSRLFGRLAVEKDDRPTGRRSRHPAHS